MEKNNYLDVKWLEQKSFLTKLTRRAEMIYSKSGYTDLSVKDLAQVGWIRAAESISGYDPSVGPSVIDYLLYKAQWAMRQELRQRYRANNRLVSVVYEGAIAPNGLDESYDTIDGQGYYTMEHVENYLDYEKLIGFISNPEHRKMLEMRLQDSSRQAVADAFNFSESRVRQLMSNFLLKIRSMINPIDFEVLKIEVPMSTKIRYTQIKI